MSKPILYYDGICVLCNRSIRFIINRDPQKKFKILQQQSIKHKTKYESVVLIINGEKHTHSTAVIKSLILLGGIYKTFMILFIIPKTVRDFMYSIVAKNRYKWFGKYDSCPTPPTSWKERFIDTDDLPNDFC